jgi:hypothetical protein
VPSIRDKLLTLQQVGLGYIHIGQPATTLSGGVARSTSSTSRPPGCISTMSASCWRCCTHWSKPATLSWSSSTISK